MTLQTYLKSIDACESAVGWTGDRTPEQAVAECERGDWMLWIAYNLSLDKRKRVLAAGLIANTVRHLMTDERSTAAVDAAIAYGNGEIGEDELKSVAAAYAAAYAASATAVGRVLSLASGASTATAARTESLLQSAAICREVFGAELIELLNSKIQTK